MSNCHTGLIFRDDESGHGRDNVKVLWKRPWPGRPHESIQMIHTVCTCGPKTSFSTRISPQYDYDLGEHMRY